MSDDELTPLQKARQKYEDAGERPSTGHTIRFSFADLDYIEDAALPSEFKGDKVIISRVVKRLAKLPSSKVNKDEPI